MTQTKKGRCNMATFSIYAFAVVCLQMFTTGELKLYALVLLSPTISLLQSVMIWFLIIYNYTYPGFCHESFYRERTKLTEIGDYRLLLW